MESETKEAEIPIDEQTFKKGRHRKKQLYNSILQQMEFYFSDSNLTKDRFLSQLVYENHYVDLAMFLKFNKIRKLTSNVEDIRKAIKNSQLIELSDDKNSICRKEPVKEKTNVDECTIYVERLQSDATHEWLNTVFSEFGNVVYVSIPKYKHNNVIKGFAFIEFDKEHEAEKVLSYFESIGCKMPSHAEPAQLCSIATFEGSDEMNVGIKKPTKVKKIKNEQTEDSCVNGEGEEVCDVVSSKIKKEKTEDSCGNGEGKIPKIEVFDSEEKVPTENSLKIKEEETEDSCANGGGKIPKIEVFDSDETVPTKKSSKRKLDEIEKKAENEENSKKLKTDVEEVSESDDTENKRKKKLKKEHKKKNFIKDLGLQVLSKKEWKRMRNRYLELQKKKMKEFKKQLYRAKYGQANYEDKQKRPNKSNEEKKADFKVASEAKKSGSESATNYEFKEGLIMKIRLAEPITDSKKLKNDIKSLSSDVMYVDVPNVGSEDIYVRFNNKDSAKEFCTQEVAGKKEILIGDEEKSYWEKMQQDRDHKFKKSNNKKERGRDKLLKKAKRIKFDD